MARSICGVFRSRPRFDRSGPRMPPLPRTMWQLEQFPFPVKNRSPAAASPAAGIVGRRRLQRRRRRRRSHRARRRARGNAGIPVPGIPLRIEIAQRRIRRGARLTAVDDVGAVAAAGAVGPVAADAAGFVGFPASLERLRESARAGSPRARLTPARRSPDVKRHGGSVTARLRKRLRQRSPVLEAGLARDEQPRVRQREVALRSVGS